jgi:hypothetical protein
MMLKNTIRKFFIYNKLTDDKFGNKLNKEDL